MTGLAFLGLVMLIVMLGAIFIGVPISFTLLFLALTFGYFGLGHVVFDLAYFQTIGMMKEELLAAVPLFIFMGFLTEQAGLMERLFNAFRMLLAPIRGALFAVVILTATVFAMATGIVGAAVTVLGIMAGPIMIKTGYDAKLSAGCITAGGTLGILIPPSVMLIVMGPVIGVSVAELYSAAFGPGLPARRHLPRVPDHPLEPQPEARPAGADGGPGELAAAAGHRGADRRGAAAHPDRRGARLDAGGPRDADRGERDRRPGRRAAHARLSQVHLGGIQARDAQHDRHLEHGAAAGGHLEHLRRGVRAPGHRELDHRVAARAAVPADRDADPGAVPDLPARLAVRVAGGDPGVPADLLSGDGWGCSRRSRRRWASSPTC